MALQTEDSDYQDNCFCFDDLSVFKDFGASDECGNGGIGGAKAVSVYDTPCNGHGTKFVDGNLVQAESFQLDCGEAVTGVICQQHGAIRFSFLSDGMRDVTFTNVCPSIAAEHPFMRIFQSTRE